jgi:hypothetical protein
MGLLGRLGFAAESAAQPKGGLLSRLAIGGGLLGGGALLASEADAQDDPLGSARSRVAELENDLNTFDKGSPTEVQQALLRKGFPLKKVDGKIGPETAAAISSYRTQTLKELDSARTRLATVEGAAQAQAVAQQRQAAFDATKASPIEEGLREVGPWATAGLGLALGIGSRSGAVKKAAAKAAEKIAASDAFLSLAPASFTKRGAAHVEQMVRPANLNEFWRLGGAGERVPFKASSSGEWRPRADVATPSELYPDQSKTFRTNDIGMIGSGLGEAGLSGGIWLQAQSELQAAQEAADKDPSEANLARLERAKDMVKVAEGVARLGLGFAAGRAGGALKMPYPSARPNIAGAEAERALILEALKKRKAALVGQK